MKKLYFFLRILIFHGITLAQSEEIFQDLQKYTNSIIQVHEIIGHKNYTLHLTFQQDNPIAIYAPESFQESQDKKFHRFILPNTQLACESSSDCIEQHQDNVELLMHGVMLLNVVGQDFILMTVGQD